MTACSPSWKWFGLVECIDSDVLFVVQAYFQRTEALPVKILQGNEEMKADVLV